VLAASLVGDRLQQPGQPAGATAAIRCRDRRLHRRSSSTAPVARRTAISALQFSVADNDAAIASFGAPSRSRPIAGQLERAVVALSVSDRDRRGIAAEHRAFGRALCGADRAVARRRRRRAPAGA
jgi:hypothetical protein